VIKSISLIVLTQFFHFNELQILRQPGYFIFKVFQVKPTIFFYSVLTWPKLDVDDSKFWKNSKTEKKPQMLTNI